MRWKRSGQSCVRLGVAAAAAHCGLEKQFSAEMQKRWRKTLGVCGSVEGSRTTRSGGADGAAETAGRPWVSKEELNARR